MIGTRLVLCLYQLHRWERRKQRIHGGDGCSVRNTESTSVEILICSKISNAPNEWNAIAPHSRWIEGPFCQYNAANWKSLICTLWFESASLKPMFSRRKQIIPNSFWQNSPLLWLALRNNPWLYGKYCRGHSSKCNITEESDKGSIYLKNWLQ